MDSDRVIVPLSDSASQVLVEAVLHGSVAQLEEALKLPLGINTLHGQRGSSAETLLHMAARIGRVDMIHCLLQHGADIEYPDDDYWTPSTPLHVAAEGVQPEAIRALLSAGADIHAFRDDVGTPLRSVLHNACFIDPKRQTAITLLLEAGLDINEPEIDCGDGTVIQEAASLGDLELVKWLVDQGADMTGTLAYSAGAGRFETAKWLIEQGMKDPTAHALQLAASRDRPDVCEIILPTTAGATSAQLGDALLLTAHFGRLKGVAFLLDAGVDVNYRNTHGRSVLGAACFGCYPYPLLIRLLIQRGAELASETQELKDKVERLLLTLS